MCGFAVLVQPGREFPSSLLADIEKDLYHRGPDSGGVVSMPGAALVFRRLSILDPRPVSDQPLFDPSRRYVLLFNGEIYNFHSVRQNLEARGVVFRTNGDTEVLLQALIMWGEAALDHLEGMYAFVFVDQQDKTLIAARDPFGIKPLYIARQGSLVVFASEMRPIVRLIGAEVDHAAMSELLVFRFAAGRLSNLRHIERLPGGRVVRLSLEDCAMSERIFCDPRAELRDIDERLDADSVDALTTAALDRSVTDHLHSDVGYCVQLSGGVDSSLLTAMTSQKAGIPISSFGIDLSPLPNDEGLWRRMVVERYGIDHTEVPITGWDYADALPQAVSHMEGPIAHTGCVLLMLLCREIAKRSKVVLTGEGADEIFGGYMRYQQWQELERKGQLASLVPSWAWPFLNRWREYRRFSGRDAAVYSSVQGDYIATGKIFPDLTPDPGARELTAREFPDFRSRLFAVDQSAYLESLLLRQDKMAMASSLEARVPFTHLPLARVINRFPHRIRVPGGETKPILKRIADLYLPHGLVHRRKIGLTIPVNDWLADERGLGRYLELLTETNSRLAEFGDRKRLRSAVECFRRGQRQSIPPLDHMIGMELWLRSLEGLRNNVCATA
jgi:asparagine synthase (glutamine-hydrolysing)